MGISVADESTFSKSRTLSASVAGAVADYVFLFSEKYLYAPKHHLPGNIAAIQRKQSEDTADPYF